MNHASLAEKEKKLIDWFQWMLLLRRFEECLKAMYRAGKIQGALHLYIGEEATAVGVCSVLTEEDCVFSTHRSHGHYLAKTHDVNGAMAELLGKASGCSRGHGGSMHLFNRAKGFMGSNGIVGGGIPLAMGSAFAKKYQGKNSIGVTFFGDGAANQGVLHETLNMCSLLRLPFLAVCENNGVAATTLTEHVTANPDRTRLAAAYDIPARIVDGNDVEAVHDAAAEAVESIRSGKGPFLLDMRTYRMEPHCGIIKDTRDKAIHREWCEKRDPLLILSRRYPDFFTGDRIQMYEKNVKAIIENALEEALKAPYPDLAVFQKEFGV